MATEHILALMKRQNPYALNLLQNTLGVLLGALCRVMTRKGRFERPLYHPVPFRVGKLGLAGLKKHVHDDLGKASEHLHDLGRDITYLTVT